MSQVKIVPNKIHLIGFRILHAEINSPFEFETDKIASFNNDVNFEMAFNLEDKMVKADFSVEIQTISTKETNENEATAKFEFVFIFNVENLDDLAKIIDENTLDINGGLSNALASIVYSTSRGILMTRFQGTAMSEFILPVIDPNELINKRKL